MRLSDRFLLRTANVPDDEESPSETVMERPRGERENDLYES